MDLPLVKYLETPVPLEWGTLFVPAQSAKFRPFNPSLRIPILLENGQSLREADASVCWLSKMVGSKFWRIDPNLLGLIRWISWGNSFGNAFSLVHFEHSTNQRCHQGPMDLPKVVEGEALLQESAAQLDEYLQGKKFLLRSGLSYADFRVTTFLLFNDVTYPPKSEIGGDC